MYRMAGFRGSRCQAGLVTGCVALGLTLGCGRSEPLKPATASISAGSKRIPFHTEAQPVSTVHSDPLTDQKENGAAPFWGNANAPVLPPGTLLTVQLDRPLAAAKVRAGEDFSASLAAPLVIEGVTLIEGGTQVTGRVEAARSHRGSGYVELTLDSMRVGGRSVALQTSSLFARGNAKPRSGSSKVDPSRKGSGSIRVPNGQRLTFRLTAPVTLKDKNLHEKPQTAENTAQ